MWANAQCDGRQADYRLRPLRSSVIPFPAPCRKVSRTPAAGVRCSNAANVGECKTST